MKERVDGGEAILEAFRRLDIDYIISSPGQSGLRYGRRWPANGRMKRMAQDT